MKVMNETGMRVCIQHLGSCHDANSHDDESQKSCEVYISLKKATGFLQQLVTIEGIQLYLT